MRKTWQFKKLGDLAHLSRGHNPPKSQFIYEPRKGYVRFYQIRDGKSDDHAVYVPESSHLKRVDPDDILMTAYRHIGQVFKGASGAFNVALCKISNKNRAILDDNYLYYLIPSSFVRGELLSRSERSLIPSMSVKDLGTIKVPLPPLPEQKRIVAILDDAFAGIDRAIENTERNLENARELFESVSKDLILGEQHLWPVYTLNNLLKKKWITGHLDGNHGSSYPRKDEFVDTGIPYISANCIKDGEVDFSLAKYLSAEKAATLRKGIAQDKDVLFAHNATVGPVAMLETIHECIILSTSLTYYRCDRDHIDPNYLAHYMRSPAFTNQYKAIMRQSTRNQVPITKQRTFTHVIPPIEIQRMIARKLDELSDNVVAYNKCLKDKLSALSELKQSILHKAFTGELTKDLVN